MPWISFFASGLWLMVIGLLGPSVPAIITEFELSYSSAGLIFTMLSAGALLGSFLAGVAADFRHRKVLWISSAAALAAGLLLVGFTSGYRALLVTIFLMSLLGGPIGAIGQAIMLQMFPEKRGKYISLQTMFAAAGSFLAPSIVALVYILGGNWRMAFFTAAGLAFLLFVAIVFLRLPYPAVEHRTKVKLRTVIGDKSVLFIGLVMLLSVGVDIGFSYWLAEYFSRTVGAAPAFSSMAVSTYLIGVMTGRFSLSRYESSGHADRTTRMGLAVSMVLLVLILNVPFPTVKLLLCPLYGMGIGPLFPYLMSKGTGLYPGKAGAVTGVLFSTMSLSGMIFPFVIGLIGTSLGIEGAYYTLLAIDVLILWSLFRLVKR